MQNNGGALHNFAPVDGWVGWRAMVRQLMCVRYLCHSIVMSMECSETFHSMQRYGTSVHRLSVLPSWRRKFLENVSNLFVKCK